MGILERNDRNMKSTLETVDNYNFFTTSFSYSDQDSNGKQKVNIGLMVC